MILAENKCPMSVCFVVLFFPHSECETQFCQLYSSANWTGTYHCQLFIITIGDNRAFSALPWIYIFYLHVYISLANLTLIVNLALGSDLLSYDALRLTVTVMLMAQHPTPGPHPSWHLFFFCLDLNYQSEKEECNWINWGGKVITAHCGVRILRDVSSSLTLMPLWW